jgi:hypothetical protein
LLSGVSTPNGQKLRQRGGSNSAHVREPGDTWALMYQPDAVAPPQRESAAGAATVGHGKSVISFYLLANEET